jgi:hypothetical protein
MFHISHCKSVTQLAIILLSFLNTSLRRKEKTIMYQVYHMFVYYCNQYSAVVKYIYIYGGTWGSVVVKALRY